MTEHAYGHVVGVLRAYGLAGTDKGAGQSAWQAPGHSPADRSLIVTDGETRVRMFCHSDPTEQVMQTVGLTFSDFYDGPSVDYRYPDGRVKHRATATKGFTQSGNRKGAGVLYRADRLAAATVVHWAEGEEDVHALESVGAVATTTASTSGPLPDLTVLHGKTVVVWRDKDDTGRKYVAKIVDALDGKANVRVVEAKSGKDASDHIAAGRTLDELVPVDVDTADPRPRLYRATDLVAAEQPKWLARNWIPFAAIALLVGDEGIGKSLFWVLVVSSVTTGRACPELGIPARAPRHVIIVITEDEWASVVLPRLLVSGAALDKISVICTERDGSGAPIFPRDIHLVRDSGLDPALVIVDAWLDTVPSGLSVRDPQQARQALHPWKEAATVTGAAVLLLTHTNRVPSANPRDKYGATGELRKKARMTLFAQVDDDGLLIGPEKANSAGKIAATRFAIDPIQHFPATEDHDGTVPLLRIVGDSGQTIREHIGEQFDDDRGEDRTEKDSAVRWLREYLEQEGPTVKSATAKADAKKAGIAERTLTRARSKLKVVVSYEGMPAVTVWSLPTDPTVVDLSPDEYTVGPTTAPYHSDVAQQDPLGISPGHTVRPPAQNDPKTPVGPTPETWPNSGPTVENTPESDPWDRCAACRSHMPSALVAAELCDACATAWRYVETTFTKIAVATKTDFIHACSSSDGSRDALPGVLEFAAKAGRIQVVQVGARTKYTRPEQPASVRTPGRRAGQWLASGEPVERPAS